MNEQNNELYITRSFNINEFRAIDDNKNKRIEGYPVIFNSSTDIGGYFFERIERGAFDECDLSDVLFFVNHDCNKIPLARSRKTGNSTMKLSVEEKGLFISADLDVENNQDARSLHSAVARGDIDGMSFAFRIKEQRWENLDSKQPTRIITKFAKVFEVSAVNNPAYKDTDISARDKVALENAKNIVEDVRNKKENNSLEIERLRTQILLKINK